MTTSHDLHDYAPAAETTDLFRDTPETDDERWLREQLDRINPHRHEMGSSSDTQTLTALVIEMRAEIQRLNSENAELYRKLSATSLSKDSGWERYEQANQLNKITQDQLLAANEARRAAQDENALLKEKLATTGLAMQRSILEATKELAVERDKLRGRVKVLREFAQFVLSGLKSGQVKAVAIVSECANSNYLEIRSLEEIASAALETTKEQS